MSVHIPVSGAQASVPAAYHVSKLGPPARGGAPKGVTWAWVKASPWRMIQLSPSQPMLMAAKQGSVARKGTWAWGLRGVSCASHTSQLPLWPPEDLSP